MNLDIAAIALLRVVKDRGGSLDLGIRDRVTRGIARRLLESGHLSGTSKKLRITAAGLAAVAS